ncbi:hypothetical protein [Novosphingopyxis sp. YJ-S2-01]|uniref:hypothetical protein n=1 Tax=Novosphingopyxis sp. YJ-S2-01 TaxID=2794021 RepID=UPI0018DDC78C|nr:hypothetical protein [Novosphingopyxis sp. YJ-S2-01]MBH9536634.1 hypothetical protein [Novosphingopyxis sp. YJ-S2-01]
MGWGILTILGPIVLVGAIAWAILRNKKETSRRDEIRTERATHELYDKADEQDARDARRDPLTDDGER